MTVKIIIKIKNKYLTVILSLDCHYIIVTWDHNSFNRSSYNLDFKKFRIKETNIMSKWSTIILYTYADINLNISYTYILYTYITKGKDNIEDADPRYQYGFELFEINRRIFFFSSFGL